MIALPIRLATRLVVCSLLALTGSSALAVPGAVSLEIEVIGGEGFVVYDIHARLDASGAGQLSIGHMTLPPPVGRVDDVEIHCATLRLSTRALHCRQGRARLSVPGLPPLSAAVSLTAGTGGRVALQLEDLQLAGGRVSIDLRREADGRVATAFSLEGLSLEGLSALWPQAAVTGLTGDGAGHLRGDAQIGADGRISAHGELSIHGTTVATDDGAVATENLAVDLRWRLVGWPDRALELILELADSGGLAYAEPVFLDLDEAALAVEARFLIEQGTPRLHALRLSDGEALALEAVGRLGADGKGWLAVNRLEVRLPAAYPGYLQPFLIGTPLDQLDSRGRVQAQGLWRDGRWARLGVDIEALGFSTRDRQLTITGLDGGLHWRLEGPSVPSSLAWSGGRLFGLELGPTELRMHFAADSIDMPGATRIPILDGALVIENLAARGIGAAAPAFQFDARLEPLSLEQLTAALGWPTLGGELAGRLPGATYANRILATEGTLEIQAFDGRISIEAPRIEALLSPLPRVTADIRIHDLDLEQLTGAFAFGQITGRLDGEIIGLRMLDWRPSAFDAWLATSTRYRGPRRISQRAIDNLTAIGGGGVARLPGGLLRVFSEFGYDRIGLSCSLRNEVCLMDGIGSTNGAYVIVRGRGLPRIDVLGTARRVSWPVLLAQLAALERLEDAEGR